MPKVESTASAPIPEAHGAVAFRITGGKLSRSRRSRINTELRPCVCPEQRSEYRLLSRSTLLLIRGCPMNLFGTPLLLLSLIAADDKPAQPAPNLPIGKETTYVSGPLDKDGYIDYEAPLNDRLGKSITAEKNANVLIWKALGPTPVDDKKMPAEFFKRLGIDEPPS